VCDALCTSGELVWPDGRRYCGLFADGQFDGLGICTQPSDDLGIEISEGTWKAGQLHGQARVRYLVFLHACSQKYVTIFIAFSLCEAVAKCSVPAL